MDALISQHSNLIRRLRQLHPSVKVEELKQFFDNLVQYFQNLTYTNKQTDGFDILTLITDDLASMHTLQLFDHLALINHPIFVYLGRTLEMLLTKSTYSQSIAMNKHEETCFSSLSYLLTQLCLHRNEPVQCFYGSISAEIFPLTNTIYFRDETIGENNQKPNLKVSALPSSAPKSWSVEERQSDITKILHRKISPTQIPPSSSPTITTYPPLLTDLPSRKYQDVFFTKSFLDKLARAIEDLAEHDYAPYHVKYQVINRLVRLCCKLNMTERLLQPIIKCLCSKFYRQGPSMIIPGQFTFSPKQLFFNYQCAQLIIEYRLTGQEQISIPISLCQSMIEATEPMIDEVHSKFNAREIARHALHYHLELLNHLSSSFTGRRYIITSDTITQLIDLLRNGQWYPKHAVLFDVDAGIITSALMLLANLAYEKEIFSILKRQDLQDILAKLQSFEVYTIQFALKTFFSILNEDQIDEENQPMNLKRDYIEYLQNLIIKSKETIQLVAIGKIKVRHEQKSQVVFVQRFFDKLIRDLTNLSTTDYPENKSIYRDASWRVRLCTKHISTAEPKSLDRDDPSRAAEKPEKKMFEPLLASIVECLNSKFYLEVHEKIELTQSKAVSEIKPKKRGLAEKHLFFMRECPEFLFRHDYKQYKDIADSLGKKMLGYTTIIFEKHLPVLFVHQGKIDSEDLARMEALSYHIKMLTHFTQTRLMRREFSRTPIVDQMLSVLQDTTLFDEHQPIPDAKLAVIGQALILLYNLALEEDVYSRLKMQNLLDICLKLGQSKDKVIHFSSQILSIMLNEKIYDAICRPDLLSKTSIEYIDKSIQEPKQLYQGVKLDGLLKNLKNISANEIFIESFMFDKRGILAIAECIYETHPENTNLKMVGRIQKAAMDLIWKLVSYGPVISKTFKKDDRFINQILILFNQGSEKIKPIAERIIWKLGREESGSSEKDRANIDDADDQLPASDEWDESIPYDLLISCSNNVNDKIWSLKIYNRLIKKGYRVYTDKVGKHRLEVMRKAIGQEKPILACLSKDYRLSKMCMTELEYAKQQSSPIIPAIIEQNFKIQGWLKHIIGEKVPTDFTDKKFDENLLRLCVEIEKFKSSD